MKKTPFPKPDTAEYKDIRDKSLHVPRAAIRARAEAGALGVKPVTPRDVDARLAAVKKKLFGK